MKRLYCIFCFVMLGLTASAQEDLLELLDGGETEKQLVSATFKGTRLINGHSIETVAGKELVFLIGHRFGRLNEGFYTLFGLDRASIRLGLEYGINDRLTLGFGRGTYEKSYDGFVKYRLLRQDNKNMPVSITYLGTTAINTLKWPQPNRENKAISRLSYVHQILIARKFNSDFSLQLMPSFVHKNLVQRADESNDIYSLGFGARYKLNKRVSLNAEYYLNLNQNLPNYNGIKPSNALALGFDIETGGHVFQLHVTNAQSMIEKGFISETVGNPFQGDLYFGFNISRTFSFAD